VSSANLPATVEEYCIQVCARAVAHALAYSLQAVILPSIWHEPNPYCCWKVQHALDQILAVRALFRS
jgi:hypothetical protein